MPVVPLALAFAAGASISLGGASSVAWAPAFVWIVWAGGTAATGALLLARRERLAAAAVLMAIAALGVLRAAVSPLAPHHLAVLALPSTIRLEGRLAAEPRARSADYTQILLDADVLITGDTRRIVTGRIQVALNGIPPLLTRGQRIVGAFRVYPPQSFRNPGGFDYRAHLARRDIYLLGSARADSVRPLMPAAPSWQTSVRRWAVSTIRGALPSFSGALLAGLLLGERSELPSEIQDAFRRAGVYHVLAVSGFNVALLATAVFAALAVLRLSLPAAAGGAIAVVVSFAMVVGAEPSVLRAVIMAVLMLLALILSREASLLNGLALAALVILAARPGDLVEPGFQLSFGATLGIVLFSEPVRDLLAERGCPRWLAEASAVTLGAQAVAAPIMLTHFNQLSLIGILSNLAVVPLAALGTLAGLLALLAAALHETLARPLFDGVWLVLLALRACVHGAARIPGAMLHLPAPPLTATFGFYAGLGVLLWLASQRQRMPQLPLARARMTAGALGAALLVAASVVALWPLLRPADGRLRVTFLDVGQGDAIVVEFPDGRTVLVDAGPGGRRRLDAGERVVAPFLWNRGVLRVAAMIVTHDDVDHAGGLPSILRLLRVDELWTAGNAAPGRRWFGDVPVTVLSPLEPVPCGPQLLRRGRRRQFEPSRPSDAVRTAATGTASLRLRDSATRAQPSGTNPEDREDAGNRANSRNEPTSVFAQGPAALCRARDRNNESIVIRIDHGLVSLLLAADIESETEAFLHAAGAPLRTTVLKVAHHGGRRSTGKAFLMANRPAFAVISVGGRNRFGHPAPETLARLREAGARMYRTDEQGAVTLESDGQELIVSTWADGRRERFILYPSNERSI